MRKWYLAFCPDKCGCSSAPYLIHCFLFFSSSFCWDDQQIVLFWLWVISAIRSLFCARNDLNNSATILVLDIINLAFEIHLFMHPGNEGKHDLKFCSVILTFAFGKHRWSSVYSLGSYQSIYLFLQVQDLKKLSSLDFWLWT